MKPWRCTWSTATQLPTMHSTMHLYPVNGAAHKRGEERTPWSYRDAIWSQVIVGVDPDPANKDEITEWARDYWSALHPIRRRRRLRQLHDGGRRGARSAPTYRENYDRLAAVKEKYDPANFFRVNQNIRPASQAASAS